MHQGCHEAMNRLDTDPQVRFGRAGAMSESWLTF